jgi:glycosyltransferase involved in cell wall biosynthesis
MSFLDQVTPIVLTWNEEANIERVFGQLAWAQRIVVDSNSTDSTIDLLARYPNVQIFQREFSTHSEQANFSLLETGVTTEWVLTIDADYVLSDPLLVEMTQLAPAAEVAGFTTAFEYWVLGRPLRGSLYPPRVTLFRRSQGDYEQEGHTQRLRLRGPAATLMNPIFHDDRKPLARWIVNQERYASLEAERLINASPGTRFDWADRIRRTGLFAPALVAGYCLLIKGCAFDGRAGLYYTFQRVVAETLLAMRLWEMRSG